ncbi:MAG: peptidylprolyl isomerase [Erysipelotrichales bacterium]|nr:peptidylprolyl isomerase [Erysipelotrichales bacterium]
MKHPIAKIYTSKGIITVELYPEYAPNTVNSFIWAIRKNMYENRVIKRIVPEYVLQPSYSYFDDDDCNYMLEGEFSDNGFDNPMKMEKWTVAMAGDGTKEAHGCEFFITLSDEAGAKLQGKYAAFGKVIDGFDVVEALVNVELKRVYPAGMSATVYQPVQDEYMEHVEVDTFEVEYTALKIKYWIRWGC